jgi:uncharacterized protein YciI
MGYFFLKLIPPRATFAQDITEEETKIMLDHGAYWRELQNKGIAIIFGPVMDPKGVWGAGIIEADTKNDVNNLAANDPAIRTGLNTIEIYPMKAVVKK